MVKFGKNKFKALNKITKKHNNFSGSTSNKVLKRKINAEKKVSFQKEVLIKEAVSECVDNQLVKNVTLHEMLLNELAKKPKPKKTKLQEATQTPKLKPIKKQKQRQKMQISDTKLLLSLMKKK